MHIMEIAGFLKLFRIKSTFSVIVYVLLFSTLMTRNFVLNEFLLLLSSNLLASWAIFSFNDLEDAKYDIKFRLKRTRNAVSSGLISKRSAYAFVIILSIFALIISLYMNILNFYLIAIIFLIGFAYSSSYFRLKKRPPFDIISHSLIGALVAASAFIKFDINFLYLTLFVTFFVDSAIPEILNQRYDYEIDKKTKTKTTVQLLGKVLSLKLLIFLGLLNFILYALIFFLYDGINLLLVYLLFSPLIIMFVTKQMRRLMEKKPEIMLLLVLLLLSITLLGFFKIL